MPPSLTYLPGCTSNANQPVRIDHFKPSSVNHCALQGTLGVLLQLSAPQANLLLLMSHCHDELSHRSHDHSGAAEHDHSDDLTPALQNHIYEPIDFAAINTLNEQLPRSGSKIVQKTARP